MVKGFRVNWVMRLWVMGSGNDVVGVNRVMRDHVSYVAVGSVVGGRCVSTWTEIALDYQVI